METKIICPLGLECEEIKNDQLHRCRWYIKIIGKGPQSEKMIDEWDCALAWMPMLLIENAMTNRGQTAAIESLRNEAKKQQEEFNQIISIGIQKRLEQKL